MMVAISSRNRCAKAEPSRTRSLMAVMPSSMKPISIPAFVREGKPESAPPGPARRGLQWRERPGWSTVTAPPRGPPRASGPPPPPPPPSAPPRPTPPPPPPLGAVRRPRPRPARARGALRAGPPGCRRGPSRPFGNRGRARGGLAQPVELDRAQHRPHPRAALARRRGGRLELTGEALDRVLQAVGVVAGGDDRVEEAAEHVLHHRHHEVVPVLEVDVERAAREPRPAADGVEARHVEAVLREGLQPCCDQRVSRFLLRQLAGARSLAGGGT